MSERDPSPSFEGPDSSEAWGGFALIGPSEAPERDAHRVTYTGTAFASGWGSGGEAPTSLDTQREIAPARSTAPGSETPSEHRGEGVSRQVRRAAERSHPFGRPVSRPWRPWVEAVADRVRAYGLPEPASALRHCGEMAMVSTCSDCGRVGRVEVRASCHTRVCPWCQRLAADRTARDVLAATGRVPGYVSTRLAGVVAEQLGEQARAAATRDVCAGWAIAARKRGNEELATRHDGRVLAAAHRYDLATRALHGLRARDSWNWKLITVSPWRAVGDWKSYTPQGLRRAVDDVCERVATLWDAGLSHGGLASLVVRVEVSSRGHVHAHCLYYGPFVTRAWLKRIAGCIVDVRKVKDFKHKPDDDDDDPRDVAQRREDMARGIQAGVRECVKYATKVVSPLRAEWLAGTNWRVMHPELAAAWLVATRNVQLIRYRGPVRDALAAAEVAGELEPEVPKEELAAEPEAEHVCPWCRGRLLGGVLAPVMDTAAGLTRDEWKRVLVVSESRA